MGRNKSNEVHSYFLIKGHTLNGTGTCKIENCAKVIRRHLAKFHNDMISAMEKQSASVQSEKRSYEEENDISGHSKRMKTITDIFQPSIRIPMTPKIFNDAMVELSTVNGRPFSIVEDTGLCKIIDPIKKSVTHIDGPQKSL